MSRQPMGKTLLRNVIRHTDAHNKIQEETEMWKMREWELQTPQRKHLSAAVRMRGRMHCDEESDPSRHITRSRVSEHDDRETRYWTKQLYEFEAKDPDRWGHSGFKELYPEEFTSDSDSSDSQKMVQTKVKKSKSGKEAKLSKRSKKSSHKKKKKKKKKSEESKQAKTECRSSGSDDSGGAKERHRKRSKSRHKNKKSVKKCRDSDSSSVDSDSEKDKDRHSYRRKKRKQSSAKPSDSEPDSKKKKRKDWRATGEDSSDGSSGD
ncbi:hypothetical protein NQD34_009466 [Periophthalmus magnuspinnatus]|uniref:NKAP domain containing 1 n=1 Tax=Periophthalmus magnuspinnatus TaxID=409849 RepID=UPI00145AAC07|nr:NKAP domain containing 1 [Periophthalmus magnuspinnatus]XP_055082119.1 NKAP domain containing 1 [Periophthalmus magnuspinnatus]KAJ0021976.1 hypothetical protein NQD34_009466 [Periophthalmus magnuspinnatus]